MGDKVVTDDQENANVRVLENHGADGVDVLLVLGNAAVSNGVLAVRGGGSAVAVGKIVDDELAGVVSASGVGLANIGQCGVYQGNLGAGVP